MTRSKTKILKTLEEKISKDKKLNAVKKEEHKPKTDIKLNNKFCKVEIGKIKTVNSHIFKIPEQVAALPYCNKLTFPDSPNITKKKKLSSSKSDVEKTFFSSFEAKSKICGSYNENLEVEFKALQKVSETTESLECKNSNLDVYKQIYYSPFATIKNDEKEKNSKKKLFENETENKENEFQDRIFSFREYIDCKTNMLLESCEKWKKNCTNFEGPSDIQGEIDSVIGKTKLLTSDKFLQFKNLIDKCEKGDPLITLDDLEGFKDWVSIEVEKINADFLNLEKLKNNDWMPENFSLENSRNRRKKIGITKKPLAKSNIRAHIQAARKMLKNEKRDYNVEFGEIKFADEEVSKTVLTNKTVESPVKNSNTSDLNRCLPVKREKRNSTVEVKTNSPIGKIVFTKKNYPGPKGSSNKNILNNKVCRKNYRNSGTGNLGATPNAFNSLKYSNIKQDSENLNKGLSEKYFRRPEDDDKTPIRVVLGEMNPNITPVKIMTRSKCDTYQNLV